MRGWRRSFPPLERRSSASPDLVRKPFLQKLQHQHFVAAQGRLGLFPARRALAPGRRHDMPEVVGLEQSRVDVVLAAYGARVAEAFRDRVDRADDVAIGLAAATVSTKKAKT